MTAPRPPYRATPESDRRNESGVCSTPGCEREPGTNGYGKCCITCVEGELQGVHLAWCRRRNGDPEPGTS